MFLRTQCDIIWQRRCSGQSNSCKQTFPVEYLETWTLYFYSCPRDGGDKKIKWMWSHSRAVKSFLIFKNGCKPHGLTRSYVFVWYLKQHAPTNAAPWNFKASAHLIFMKDMLISDGIISFCSCVWAGNRHVGVCVYSCKPMYNTCGFVWIFRARSWL